VRCPLTLLENWLEQKAGVEPYQGGFLLLTVSSTALSQFQSQLANSSLAMGLCFPPSLNPFFFDTDRIAIWI
jgi:hypothetical protein